MRLLRQADREELSEEHLVRFFGMNRNCSFGTDFVILRCVCVYISLSFSLARTLQSTHRRARSVPLSLRRFSVSVRSGLLSVSRGETLIRSQSLSTRGCEQTERLASDTVPDPL